MDREERSSLHMFIDANIWLYAIIDTQDPVKSRIAKEIIQTTTFISVSTQIINEVCVNIVKNRFLDEIAIQALIDSFYTRYNVIDVSRIVIKKASEIRTRYAVSYWDSLVLAAALENGCVQLLSEDMQHGLHVDD